MDQKVQNTTVSIVENGKKIYEGGEQDKYYCKYCGKWERDLWKLTNGLCNKSGNKRHFPQ